jgi:hypothetical protein
MGLDIFSLAPLGQFEDVRMISITGCEKYRVVNEYALTLAVWKVS